MNILMSIRKKYCDAIFDGRKTIELRKNKPAPYSPHRVFVYESKGRGMVVGEFVCYAVCSWSVSAIWNRFGDKICVTRHELDAYYGGRDVGYTWYIRDAVRYDTPLPLSEFGVYRPPQSWCYLHKLE